MHVSSPRNGKKTKNKSTSLHLFFCACLFICINMGLRILFCSICCHPLILLLIFAQIVPDLDSGDIFMLAPLSFRNGPHSCLISALLSGSTRYSKLILNFSPLIMESVISPRSPRSLWGKLVFTTYNIGVKVTHCYAIFALYANFYPIVYYSSDCYACQSFFQI